MSAYADIIDELTEERAGLRRTIRSLRAKLMRERANAHDSVAHFIHMVAILQRDTEDLSGVRRFRARARRLRAKAERIEGNAP